MITNRMPTARLQGRKIRELVLSANEVAETERQRLIGLAQTERENPRSGSYGGNPENVVLFVTDDARIRYTQPTFQFGIPDFRNEILSSVNTIFVHWVSEYAIARVGAAWDWLVEKITKAFGSVT